MTTNDSTGLLWHYTNQEGLLGIVQGQCLWATDARYLNDTKELTHSLDCLQAAWNSAIQQAKKQRSGVEPTEEEQTFFNVEALDRLLDVHSGGHEEVTVVANEPAPFIACFCAEADLLSQWRGYAGGSGYALGFRHKDLTVLTSTVDADTVSQVLKVEYLNFAGQIPKAGGRPDPKTGRVNVSSIEQAWFKHPGFQEEHEWRIAVAASPDLKVHFRPGAHGPTPYLKLDLSKCAPTEICIGPGGDPGLREAALRDLLDSMGWKDTKISLSGIPYRG